MIVDFGDYLAAYLGGLAVLFAAVTVNELVRRWRDRRPHSHNPPVQ